MRKRKKEYVAQVLIKIQNIFEIQQIISKIFPEKSCTVFFTAGGESYERQMVRAIYPS